MLPTMARQSRRNHHRQSRPTGQLPSQESLERLPGLADPVEAATGRIVQRTDPILRHHVASSDPRPHPSRSHSVYAASRLAQ